MSSTRNFIVRTIEEDRWHLWIPATALAVVAYWQVATLFLEPANVRAARPLPDAFAFTQMVFHPKPYDPSVYVAGYIVVPLLAFGLVVAAQRLRQAGHLTDRFLRLWPFALLTSALLFVLFKVGLHLASLDLWRQMPPRGNLIVQGLLVGSVLTAFWARRWFDLGKFMAGFERLPWPKLRWAVVALVVLLVFSPNFPVDHDHYNGHLGPANDILHGKQFLRETSSFYGLLDIYTLVAIFRFGPPLSYQAFSVVLMAAFAIWYLGWYALLRRWLKSEATAALAVLAMVVFFNIPLKNFDFAYGSPSNTPFHQLSVLVIAWLVWRYGRMSVPGRRAEFYLILATAGALFWSTDVGIYLLIAVLSVFFFKDFVTERSWQRGFVAFARQAATLGAMVIILGSIYSIVQFWWYGSWPDWAMFYRAANFYQSGYMLLPLPSHGLYYVYIFAFFVGLGYILWCGFRHERVAELLLPLFVVSFAIFQMFYYISRPHSDNLAPRLATFLIVLIAWGYTRWRSERGLYPELAATVSAVLTGLLILAGSYGIYKFGYTFRARDYVHLRANYRAEALRRSDVYGGRAVNILDDIAVLKREYGSVRPITLIHWLDGKMLIDLNTVNLLPIYTLQSVFKKSQMDDLIGIVRMQKPPLIFVGRVGSPGFESFREYTDKIEYFRKGVADLYVLDRQLITLDILKFKPH